MKVYYCRFLTNLTQCFLVCSLFLLNPALAQSNLAGSDHYINMALKIEYAIGYSTVYYKDYKTVRNFAELLKKHPDSKVYVAGHTDSTGTHKVNQELSDGRAEHIKLLLIKYGIDPSRITTKGYSEDYPIATNKTKVGRKKNRRSVTKISGLSENDKEQIMATIRESSVLALLDENGKFVNSNKYIDFYNYQNQSAQAKTTEVKQEEEPQEQVFENNEQNEQSEQSAQEDEQVVEQGFEQEEFEEAEEPVAKREAATESLALNKSEYDVEDHSERKNIIYASFMPSWNSKYYEGNISFEYGGFNVFGFGLAFEREFNNRFYGRVHAYYLPASVRQGESGIQFTVSDGYNYENNIYGVTSGYVLRSNKKMQLALEGSLNSHILGGFQRTSLTEYTFSKSDYRSLGLGVNYRRPLFRGWNLNTGFSYLVPLSISGVKGYSGGLWYKGNLGASKALSNKLALNFDYQLIYHETELEFESGSFATPEFLLHTLFLGVGYKF